MDGNDACMYVCVPCVRLVLRQARRRHRIPWNWTYRWSCLCLLCGYWELNLCPLEYQQVLLTLELSVWLWFFSFSFFSFLNRILICSLGLASNSVPSCPNLPNTGILGVCDHIWLNDSLSFCSLFSHSAHI